MSRLNRISGSNSFIGGLLFRALGPVGADPIVTRTGSSARMA